MFVKAVKKPDGPKGSVLLGSTKKFAMDTLGFITQCRKEYKDIAYAKIAFRDFYLLFKAEYIHHVLQDNYRNYKKSFAYKGLKTILGNGLLTSEGDFWLKQRRMSQPAFHKERLRNISEVMYRCTEDQCRFWGNRSLDMNEEMRQLTQDIVTKALFSTTVKVNPERLSFILEKMRNYSNEKMKNPFMLPLYFPTSSNKEYQQAFQEFDQLMYAIISERFADPQSYNDLLSMLMEAKDPDTGEKMSLIQLRDEIATIFAAGQETTASAMCFIFYLLATHPAIEQKLMDEINANIITEGLTIDKLVNYPYSNLIIREALRLYPPAWAVSRTAVEDDQLGEYTIPKGGIVFLSIYAMHRSPEYWNNPDQFIPERFLPENFSAEQKKAYMPFGAGARICIGNNFALMEMQIVLLTIYKKYRLKLDKDFDPKIKTPITMSFKNVLTMKAIKH